VQKDRKNLDELGMKAFFMVNCSWLSEEWDYIGIEQWPTIKDNEKRKEIENEELEVSKYVEFVKINAKIVY
jgi:hypothetical protein